MKKYLSLILVIIWGLLIFGFSSDNGEKSGSLSHDVLVKIVDIFTSIEPNTNEMEEVVEFLSFPARKCAHFFMYFCFGFLVMNSLYLFGFKKNTLLISSIICFIYAISDEVHQAFIPGRSAGVGDILLDSSAALFASYIYHKFIIFKTYYK